MNFGFKLNEPLPISLVMKYEQSLKNIEKLLNDFYPLDDYNVHASFSTQAKYKLHILHKNSTKVLFSVHKKYKKKLPCAMIYWNYNGELIFSYGDRNLDIEKKILNNSTLNFTCDLGKRRRTHAELIAQYNRLIEKLKNG